MDILTVHNLDFSYPDKPDILNNISFSVIENEKIALIGPNGAGKSTLLLCLNGVLKAKKGEIIVKGLKLTNKNRFEIRKNIGLVFQNPDDQLFSPTVFDDVAFAPLYHNHNKKDIERLVELSLSKVDLIDYKQRSSHHLSYGEKKRLSIATVLSYDPPLLIFDEPTANLDPLHRRKIIDLIKSLNKTIIIVTHDLDLVDDICSRVLVIFNGIIKESGPTQDILLNKELLAKYCLELPLKYQK